MGMYDVTAESFFLSKEMDDRACAAMRCTWDAIAADVLELSDGNMTRDEVLEMVLDADRMTMYGDDNKAAEYTFMVMRYYKTYWKTLGIQAFPYENYG